MKACAFSSTSYFKKRKKMKFSGPGDKRTHKDSIAANERLSCFRVSREAKCRSLTILRNFSPICVETGGKETSRFALSFPSIRTQIGQGLQQIASDGLFASRARPKTFTSFTCID